MEYLSVITHVETYSLHTFNDATLIKNFEDVRTLHKIDSIDYLIESHYISNSGALKLYTGTQR